MWNDDSDNQGDLQYDFNNQLKLQSTSRSANAGGYDDDDDDEQKNQDEDDDVERSNYKNVASQLLWSNQSVADLSTITDPWGKSSSGGDLVDETPAADAWANFGSSSADNFADFDSHFADLDSSFGSGSGEEKFVQSFRTVSTRQTTTNPFIAQEDDFGAEIAQDSVAAQGTTSFIDELTTDNVPDSSLEDSNDEIIT